ncbi:MAG: hypothetical protein RMK19_06920 [Bacteroidia bacterium]|nr:hypothetical protein [Bacteroidia bacterium]MDW8015728.1 hypothetical protein [Bacteroidia bacterium]
MKWVGVCLGTLFAQGTIPIGQWASYAYHGSIQQVAYVKPYFWFLSQEGIVLLDGENGGYLELDRTRGLLSNRPTALYGDPYAEWIFIGYADGQVQYGPSPSALQSLRDIAANPFYTSKAIRDFHARGDTLYIATDFGLVIWSKRRRQVLASISQFAGQPFAQPVRRVFHSNGRVWALLEGGLYALPEGRPWTGPWERTSSSGILDTVEYFQGWAETPMGLLVAYKGQLYRWSSDEWQPYELPPPLGGKKVFRIYGEGGGWAIAADTTDVFYFGINGRIHRRWNPGPSALWMSPDADYVAWGSVWTGGHAASPNQLLYTQEFQRLQAGSVTEVLPTPEGLFFLHDGTGFWGPGWGNVITFYPHGAQKGIKYELSELAGFSFGGLAEAAWDGSRAWILALAYVLRLTPAGEVDTFTAYNAPFDGIFPDENGKPRWLGFSTLAIDPAGNVWVGKRYGIQNVLCYSRSLNRWYVLPISDPVISLRVDTRGYKWVLLSGGKIAVIDDRRGLEPNQYRIVIFGSGGRPLPGLPSSRIQVLAPDRGGAIWLGTDKGIAILYGDPFSENISISLPVIENRYLLEEESITDIAVDGQNRKWVGTTSSGVYLLSADGSRQLANFNMENSPLPANLIYRIRLWETTGEIFFITAEGTVSYRDWTTAPAAELDTLYIFPNPVSRRFEGWVGIRGVSEGSVVRILTVDGQMVRYLQAFGGQAVWDLRTISGEKVSPGIYLIAALDREGQRSALGKIIVVD